MTRLSEAQVRKRTKPKLVRISTLQWDARLIPGGVWIQVPQVPPSLNVWKNWHWGKQNRYKKELTKAIGGLRMAFKLPRYRLATVQIIYYFRMNRRRDPQDNYCPKFIGDSLVQGGILEDDNGELVRFSLPKLEVDRDRPRVEIFIWEAGNEAKENKKVAYNPFFWVP